MNWKSAPDSAGTWLRMSLDEGVPDEAQVHTINQDNDGALFIGNHYRPNGPRGGYFAAPLEEFNRPNYLWLQVNTDYRGIFQGDGS